MSITIAIPKETYDDRVAMVPNVVDKFLKLGTKMNIQHEAGHGIFVADEAYKNTTVLNTAAELYVSGDMIIKVNPPSVEEVNQMKEGSILITLLYPHNNPEVLKALCAKKITCFAMEMVPRISRAQIMDVLSTQATAIGYKAVIAAADSCKFMFPMIATAAGTIKPAKVLIIGIGVAGLQAIATARRLGARVEAYDVRPETKLEAESLGAKFVDTGVKASGEGGYARELTAEEKKMQQDVLAKHIAESDVVITTAGVPGKPAPKILSKEVVAMMKPGAIIVDTMAEMGGNCELTKAGKMLDYNGVMILGMQKIPSSLAINASEMYAKNILNFITPMFTKEGNLNLDWKDEVISGSCATHEGKVMHPMFKKLVEG
jgi:NAD(P) transhydrogenase subunit alpha